MTLLSREKFYIKIRGYRYIVLQNKLNLCLSFLADPWLIGNSCVSTCCYVKVK